MSSKAEPATVSHPGASNPDPNLSTSAATSPAAHDIKAADTNKSDEKPPSADVIKKVEDYMVLDKQGEKLSFKSIYDGPDSTERVLVIFIRHFFCGSCQEYIRALSESINPDQLLQLPTPTSFAIIGCGDPGLIDFYAKETACPFPIYADPANTLYDELGMTKTWALGSKPEYFRKSMVRLISGSIMQGLKHLSSGLATKGGDTKRVGGEFLFETGLGGRGKEVIWCHRMTNTRDHTGTKELAEMLDKEGKILLQKV